MEMKIGQLCVSCICKANVVFCQVEEACDETSAQLGSFPAAVKR